MKYLLVEDQVRKDQVVLDSIAEFLWNSGNEIYASNHINNRSDYLSVADSCDCIVLLVFRDCPIGSIAESEQAMAQVGDDFGGILAQKLILVFSNTGVYCNAIPFPHKIFHFEELCQSELTRFFHWCGRLSPFAQSLPASVLSAGFTNTTAI